MMGRSTMALAVAAAVAMAGCSSAPKVERTDVQETVDLSGNWNDSDSRMTAETMVKDAMARSWMDTFRQAQKREPRVIVGTVLNRSHEHINTQTFVNDLQRALINDGRVKFVASKDERDEIREERKDQAQNARQDTVKSMGKEFGADFMLKGQINTIEDAAGKQQVKYYQVELELIDLESNEKAWIGQEKIKKVVTYRRRKF